MKGNMTAVWHSHPAKSVTPFPNSGMPRNTVSSVDDGPSLFILDFALLHVSTSTQSLTSCDFASLPPFQSHLCLSDPQTLTWFQGSSFPASIAGRAQ